MALVVSAVISRILLPHKSSWLSRFSWFVHNVHSESKAEDARKNVLGIQMLSFGLHRQLFGSDEVNVSASDVKKSIDHLKMHDLWGKETSVLPDVNFQLPKLFGNNLDEHFQHIARQQSEKYTELALMLASTSLPPVPTHWHFDSGWIKYNADGSYAKVDYPDSKALVFDVEVLMSEGYFPTLATAASSTEWYSWCSEYLIENQVAVTKRLSLSDLIPLETKSGQRRPPSGTWEEKLVIGHNVSFDRAFVKEQYFIKGSKLKFLDTMSLHIANSGLTGLQRALFMANETGSSRKEVEEAKQKARGPPVKDWMEISSMNNLADIYKLYCKGPELQKQKRETFVSGCMEDVRQDFQALMSYCSQDVIATHKILSVLLPVFFERFPHPVTFAGMLEMSSAYLPVNHNWERYINDAQAAYNDLERELKLMLMRLANDACELLEGERYKDDPWLWDIDWTVKKPKLKKISIKKSSQPIIAKNEVKEAITVEKPVSSVDKTMSPSVEVQQVLETVKYVYLKYPKLVGYPAWYCDLCHKSSSGNTVRDGPTLISTQMQITPKLLRLTWDGYPLHYSSVNGWGYLVPGKPISELSFNENFPLQKVEDICSFSNNMRSNERKRSEVEFNLDEMWEEIVNGVADSSEDSQLWNLIMKEKKTSKKSSQQETVAQNMESEHPGVGPFINEKIPGCWFYRLPHKDGPQYRVGNPLAKDFLNKIEDGTLKSSAGALANRALKTSKMISYWKNAHKRITSQMVVWFKKGELPENVLHNSNYEEQGQYGVILPKIITAGTVTRRAVEPTWLTASNAYSDRVGSELKSMIQAFPGYHFVGADVDSQELWIASILGDSNFAGIHGCTSLGWMTLQGKKSNHTDLHSRTALSVGITRDQAKILNYGRIYGAGLQFASRLLMQFNHRLKVEEAKMKAQNMYAATKGVRGYILNKKGRQLLAKLSKLHGNLTERKGDLIEATADQFAKILSRKELYRLLRETQCGLEFIDVVKKTVWMNGTESAMFNRLEDIALSPEPETPFLSCKISRALEPAFVGDHFMTSRVNWVVQSSAVDYLHLILVAMRWLFDTFHIDGRFCISIHDEVRYLVKSEDRYRGSLALQISNLLTRCFFAFKLGMNDLPQSVAFFSAVDVDTVLRKEVHFDCITPSNIHGLEKGYSIQNGEALDIFAILEKTGGSCGKVKPCK